MRNDMVFNGKVFDLEQIIDIFKFRLASWFKAKWPETSLTNSDMARFPKDTKVPKVCKAKRRSTAWVTPPSDHLKFNVDGSSWGKPGPAGIGGVLRDCNGSIKAVFSMSIRMAIQTWSNFWRFGRRCICLPILDGHCHIS